MMGDFDNIFDKFIIKIEEGLIGIVRKHSSELQKVLIREHLSGPTGSSSVSRRTGGLARSVRAIDPALDGSKVSGGIEVSAKYARVHIGKKGTSTVIKPTKKKFLAIPLAAAKTSAGVPRGGPLDGIWGPTFISKGIIFGKAPGTKEEGSKPIPLFVLKGSVVVPRRIGPVEDLYPKIRPAFVEDIKNLIHK